MKIVITEKRGNELGPEREFEELKLIVGRDPKVCALVFLAEDWPMVSREHAEFYWHGELVWLRDLDSRFGTFIQGQRIISPAQINDLKIYQRDVKNYLREARTNPHLKSPDLPKSRPAPVGSPSLKMCLAI